MEREPAHQFPAATDRNRQINTAASADKCVSTPTEQPLMACSTVRRFDCSRTSPKRRALLRDRSRVAVTGSDTNPLLLVTVAFAAYIPIAADRGDGHGPAGTVAVAAADELERADTREDFAISGEGIRYEKAVIGRFWPRST